MAFRIKGDWITTCSCQMMCPCPIDGPPSAKDGHCRGAGVFHIQEGNADKVDLSGVSVGMIYHAPGHFSAGQLHMGVVLDPSVSDEQASAIEKIFRGEDGGPFAQMAPLITKWELDRAPVKVNTGKNPSATIGTDTINVEVAMGPDGNPTVVKNAAQAWRAEGYSPGRGSGKFSMFGIEYESVHGEHSEFEFAS